MPRGPQRDAGLKARHAAKLARVRRGCRYIDLDAGLCGNEAVADDAPLLLCPRHYGLALEHLLPLIKAKYLAEVEAVLDDHNQKVA